MVQSLFLLKVAVDGISTILLPSDLLFQFLSTYNNHFLGILSTNKDCHDNHQQQ